MNGESSKDCPREERTDRLVRQVRRLLTESRRAVIAMSSGGCARYVFSMGVDYCLDRKGYPLIHYTSDNAHHHLIVTNSTMDFRLNLETSDDGMEISLAILTGMLEMVDPGDHDSIDRYSRYFDVNVENYSRGHERLYRFVPEQVRVEWISGRQVALSRHEIVVPNLWTPGQEMQLIEIGNTVLRAQTTANKPVRMAGVDRLGLDLAGSFGLQRMPFRREPYNQARAAKAVQRTLENMAAVSF